MHKLVFIFLFAFVSLNSFAQDEADTIPPYKKTDKIPYFTILQPDSTWYTVKDLPDNKPVVIVYFSPECGHCMLTAQEFVRDMDKLKDVELIWTSYHSPKQMKDFADGYGLTRFNNVILGRDVNYFFVPFYRIPTTPFMAVYDKKGKFLKEYIGGTDAGTIAQLLKNAK